MFRPLSAQCFSKSHVIIHCKCDCVPLVKMTADSLRNCCIHVSPTLCVCLIEVPMRQQSHSQATYTNTQICMVLTHTYPDPSEYSWRRYPAGLFEMEHHHELKATSRAIFLPIALVALLGRAVSGHSLRIVCSSWPRQRKMGMSTDKHGCIIRAAVMCQPLCASRQTVGDLEEAGIPSRLSGKSG